MRAHPVTIHRPGAPVLDASGNPTRDANDEIVYSPAQDIQSSAWRVSPVRGVEISVDRQTVKVDASGAFPPDAVLPEPTDEISAGFPPVRYRVLAVFAVPCARTNRTKYVRADLERIA